MSLVTTSPSDNSQVSDLRRQLVRCLFVAGTGLLLLWLSGGLFPTTWRMLLHILVQMRTLGAGQGTVLLTPLAVLVVQSLFLLIAWLWFALIAVREFTALVTFALQSRQTQPAGSTRRVPSTGIYVSTQLEEQAPAHSKQVGQLFSSVLQAFPSQLVQKVKSYGKGPHQRRDWHSTQTENGALPKTDSPAEEVLSATTQQLPKAENTPQQESPFNEWLANPFLEQPDHIPMASPAPTEVLDVPLEDTRQERLSRSQRLASIVTKPLAAETSLVERALPQADRLEEHVEQKEPGEQSATSATVKLAQEGKRQPASSSQRLTRLVTKPLAPETRQVKQAPPQADIREKTSLQKESTDQPGIATTARLEEGSELGPTARFQRLSRTVTSPLGTQTQQGEQKAGYADTPGFAHTHAREEPIPEEDIVDQPTASLADQCEQPAPIEMVSHEMEHEYREHTTRISGDTESLEIVTDPESWIFPGEGQLQKPTGFDRDQEWLADESVETGLQQIPGRPTSTIQSLQPGKFIPASQSSQPDKPSAKNQPLWTDEPDSIVDEFQTLWEDDQIAEEDLPTSFRADLAGSFNEDFELFFDGLQEEELFQPPHTRSEPSQSSYTTQRGERTVEPSPFIARQANAQSRPQAGETLESIEEETDQTNSEVEAGAFSALLDEIGFLPPGGQFSAQRESAEAEMQTREQVSSAHEKQEQQAPLQGKPEQQVPAQERSKQKGLSQKINIQEDPFEFKKEVLDLFDTPDFLIDPFGSEKGDTSHQQDQEGDMSALDEELQELAEASGDFVFGDPFEGPLPDVFHHDEDLKRSIIEQTQGKSELSFEEAPGKKKHRRRRSRNNNT